MPKIANELTLDVTLTYTLYELEVKVWRIRLGNWAYGLREIFIMFDISVREFSKKDIALLSERFISERFYKTVALFEAYYQQQVEGRRRVFIAIDKEKSYLGYVTILWQSDYQHFLVNNIPEINDLNVLPSKQQQGVATQLLNFVEEEIAKKNDYAGLAVGLSKDYGAAQSLYIKRGYIPDKAGITYQLKPVATGAVCPIDDDCVLWLIKDLRG